MKSVYRSILAGIACALPLTLIGSLGFATSGSSLAAQVENQSAESSGSAQVPVGALDGASLYKESGCEYCHGVGAAGTSKAPSLLGVSKRHKPEAIDRQIHDGGGAMPAFGASLTQPQIDQLVSYLSMLRRTSTKKPAASKPSAVSAVRPFDKETPSLTLSAQSEVGR